MSEIPSPAEAASLTMTDWRERNVALMITIIAVIVVVFGFDWMVPREVAGAVPYVAAVCLASRARSRRWIWVTATACFALTVLGYFFQPPAGEAWKAIFNRALALFAIGVTAAFCDTARRTRQEMQRTEQDLREQVDHRTAELARSVAELQFAYSHTQNEDRRTENKSAIVREVGGQSAEIETFDDFLDNWARQARALIGAHQSALSYFPLGNIAEGQHAISLSEKYERFRTYDVLPTGEGIWSLVIHQKLSFCLTDEELKSHPAWKDFSDLRDERGLEHPPMRGWLAVPVLSRDQKFVGLLQLSDKYDGDFTEDDLQQLTRLARLMAPSFSLQFAIETLQRRNEELTSAKSALEASNMELQQFAYIASHDLQTPLRGVSGFAQFLQKDFGGKLGAKADDYLRRIVDSARRMQELINDLLAYSSIESRSAPFEPTSLNEVFDDAVALLDASIADAAAEVTRDELPIVDGDRPQLSQLFQNLIGNAVKYRGDEPPRIHASAQDNGDHWTIAVRDNGIGIAEKHHERVFEIFRRLHTADKYPGTGIGLAVCRRIVQRHGGTIWLASEPGEGCTFHISMLKRNGEQA